MFFLLEKGDFMSWWKLIYIKGMFKIIVNKIKGENILLVRVIVL